MTHTRIYWIQAISPLHVGSGKGVGFIDVPIIREKVTNWPYIPGSSVKGVIRDHFERNENNVQKEYFKTAFGHMQDAESSAGSLVLTDAHIVFLPVRSLYGTFGYITSPLVLERLKRDLTAAGYQNVPEIQAPSAEENNERILITTDSGLVNNNQIFFEDLDFTQEQDHRCADLWAQYLAQILFPGDTAWQEIFTKRLAIVSDNTFNFLSETGTEVAAHIRINPDTKIVQKGALWYEETLPAEAILAGIVWCDQVRGKNGVREDQLLDHYCKSNIMLQMGGKATVGKGRVNCLFSQGSVISQGE